MTDLTKRTTGTALAATGTTPALVPTGHIHPRKMHWYSTYGGSVGAMTANIFLVPAAALGVFSAFGFATGDIITGIGFAFATSGVGGAFVGLGHLGKHYDKRDQQRALDTANRWDAWLHVTYGLDLTPAQHNELVNADTFGHDAHMRKALTWGKTTIVRDGKTTRLKLMGDEKSGYQVLMHNGIKWVPLPKQQPVELTATVLQPDTFPAYNHLPTALRHEVSRLYDTWRDLDARDLSVEDRYTVTAVATDYLPNSLALLAKFTEQDPAAQRTSEELFHEQIDAMRAQVAEIKTRTDQQQLKQMKAHTLFLQNRKPV